MAGGRDWHVPHPSGGEGHHLSDLVNLRLVGTQGYVSSATSIAVPKWGLWAAQTLPNSHPFSKPFSGAYLPRNGFSSWFFLPKIYIMRNRFWVPGCTKTSYCSSIACYAK
jgi:hypothetical protein